MSEEENLEETIKDTLGNLIDGTKLIFQAEEVGHVDVVSQVDSLRKAAYYVVFASKEHKSSSVGEAIQSVHLARFESKAQLKKVINSLESNNFKLVDIIKGRPLPYQIQIKKVSEIKIGA